MADVPIYGWSVNLDERGLFFADLRNAAGETVFEVRAPDEDGGSIFEDGFMRHKADLEGLRAHLADIGLLPADAVVLPLPEAEARLARRAAEAEEPTP